MSGKEEFQQEIPLPPPYEDWKNASVIENQLTFDEQQELDQILMHQHPGQLMIKRSMKLLDTINQHINTFCHQQEK